MRSARSARVKAVARTSTVGAEGAADVTVPLLADAAGGMDGATLTGPEDARVAGGSTGDSVTAPPWTAPPWTARQPHCSPGRHLAWQAGHARQTTVTAVRCVALECVDAAVR